MAAPGGREGGKEGGRAGGDKYVWGGNQEECAGGGRDIVQDLQDCRKDCGKDCRKDCRKESKGEGEGGREGGRGIIPQGMPLAEEDEALQVRSEDDLILGEFGDRMKSHRENPEEGGSDCRIIDRGWDGGGLGGGGGGGWEGDEYGAVEGGVFHFAGKEMDVGDNEMHQHVGHGGGDS